MNNAEEVLETMLTKLRIAERSDVCGGDTRKAERVLRSLHRDGFIHRFVTTAKHIRVSEPLYRWPEDGEPEVERLAYRIAKREAAAKPKRCDVFFASRKASNALGGYGRDQYRSFDSLCHDLITSSYYSTVTNAVRSSWVGEAELAARALPGEKLPDAQVTIDGHQVAIEACNRYSAVQLRRKHQFFTEHEIDYQFI